MRIIFLTSFLFILLLSISAQKQDHEWIVGADFDDNPQDSLLGTTRFDFNFDPVKIYYDSTCFFDFGETNSVISDAETGELQLYTNGMYIANAQHEKIFNGDSIGYGESWEQNNFLLNDTFYQVGINLRQYSLFLNHPNFNNKYYLFQQSYNGFDNIEELQYNEVEHINGRYEVVVKDNIIIQDSLAGSVMNACQHANGKDWWIIQPRRDIKGFYTLHFNGDTITSFVQYEDTQTNFGVGTAHFSSDGSKYGISMSVDINDSLEDDGLLIMIFDFDRCDGDLDLIATDTLFNPGFCGSGSFSPSGRFYYSTNGFSIWQYDLYANDITASRLVIAEIDDFVNDEGFRVPFGFLTLAPDGMIYVGDCNGSRNWGKIEKPDLLGLDCTMNQHSLVFSAKIPTFLPHFPNYRLGPLDGSDCDTLGVDNHPIAKYRYIQDTTDHFQVDFVDLSYYRPEQYSWDFGDGETSMEENPTHTFDGNGVYEVCLTVSNENSSNTSCRTIMLGTTAVGDELLQADISVFPNPVKDDIILSFHDYIPMQASLVLYDTQGRKIAKYDIQSGMNMVDLTALHTGIYLYQVLDGGQVLKSGKLSKI